MSNDETTPNVALLRKAVEWVEAEAARPQIDRKWRQNSWVSSPMGRAYMMLYGEYGYESEYDCRVQNDMVQQVAANCGTAYCVAGYVGQMLDPVYAHDSAPNGVPHVSEFARQQLGLTPWQADMLFDSGNSAQHVRQIAEEIAGERL